MNIMLNLSAANKNENNDDVILQNVLEEIKNKIIKQSNAENANAKEENIIQQDVLKKVEDEIIERIETVKANGNKESENIINTPITYNSILISGARGAGKTSFLFSLRNNLKENTDIEILDFLDPTL